VGIKTKQSRPDIVALMISLWFGLVFKKHELEKWQVGNAFDGHLKRRFPKRFLFAA